MTTILDVLMRIIIGPPRNHTILPPLTGLGPRPFVSSTGTPNANVIINFRYRINER